MDVLALGKDLVPWWALALIRIVGEPPLIQDRQPVRNHSFSVALVSWTPMFQSI